MPQHDEIRYRILKLLEADPAHTPRELAEALGLSLGKTNYCLRALQATQDRKAALAALRKLVQVAASGRPLTCFYDKKQCHEVHSFQYLGKTRSILRIRQGDIRLAFYYGEDKLIFLPLVFPKRQDKLTQRQKALLEAHTKPFIDAEATGSLHLITVVQPPKPTPEHLR